MKNEEDLLQSKIVVWFKNTYQMQGKGLIFSCPNGGSRNAVEAKKLKETGLMPGVSDLIILFQNKAYFLELKTPKGIQSDDQKKFQQRVENLGFEYKIIRSYEEAKMWIENL